MTKEYEIGDVVPYINTASKIVWCKVVSFRTVDRGKIWFNGNDTKTNAEVFYPVHLSKNYLAAMDFYARQEAIAYSKFCDDLKINADRHFNVPKSMTAEEQYEFFLQSKQQSKQ